jgi:hypothetical protein
MNWDDIASEADQKIQEASGGSRGDRGKYIEGLENVIGNLEGNLEAAQADQKAADGE